MRGQAERLAGFWPLAAAMGLLVLMPRLTHAGVKFSGGGVMIARNTTAAAGQSLASGGLALNNAVGEMGAASSSGGAFRLHSGLMNLAAQPGSVTLITAVSKATGTLDLAWTAPGVDGFEGQVVSGFYRLDYSSESAHVFSPTIFKAEFSTNVVPGSAQSLQVTGLEPNTTYYTKVYLADARKYFAEDSRRSDESTLANVPVNPVLASVGSSSVTITWTLPAGSAEGYGMNGSTTNFGSLLPGGAVITSATANGLQVSLRLNGLRPATTYFFKVASLNWQGDKNFTTVLATCTLPHIVLPVSNVVAAVDSLSRRVTVSWTNPVFDEREGVLVLLSTSPAPTLSDGEAFSLGQTLGDNSLVKSTATAVVFNDAGLTLDTTYFYHLYTQGSDFAYSVSVSTAIFLDLAPMAPAGLTGVVNSNHTQIALSWKPVTSNVDGSLFPSTVAPRAVDLAQYDVYRTTSLVDSTWVRITTLPVTDTAYTADIPNLVQTFFYKVQSADPFANRDRAMVVDTDRSLFVFAPDNVTRLQVPETLSQELKAGFNQFGSDLIVRTTDEPANPSQKIFRSTRFEVVKSPSNEPLSQFQFSKPDLNVVLRYEVAGGQIVPSGIAAAGRAGVAASADPNQLGMYWDDGSKYVKLFGKVDPAAQTVSVASSRPGSYQIRSLARADEFLFDPSTIVNRAITPNGDRKNDSAVFRYDNPRDSAVSGQIFDLTGAFVSNMAPGVDPNTLQWDAKAGGRVVAGGVYIYKIQAEGKSFSGTVVVVR